MKKILRNNISHLQTKSLPSVRVKNRADNKRKLVNLVEESLFLGVLIGLAIFGIYFMWSWSISTSKVQPEAFTELYFKDNLSLPTRVIPKHPYFFQFTIHNLEGEDMEYSYAVYIKVRQNKLNFDKGKIFVKNNEYQTFQEKFSATSILSNSEVVVNLINKNQQIDFWINR